jgi:hypothetical protein
MTANPGCIYIKRAESALSDAMREVKPALLKQEFGGIDFATGRICVHAPVASPAELSLAID